MADGWAQDYPSKPIRYIVPSSAGSAVDTIGRIVAGGLGEIFGQQVIVDNRAGAGGNIGAAIAAKTPPDGYTLLQVNNNHATNVTLYRNLGYDLVRDFAPVTQLALSPYVIVVHPSLPVKSVGDLIKLAKARPGAINYASAGVGSGTFMAAELFKSQAGVDMVHVPYVGGGPALTSVIAGETVVYGAPLSTALPQIRQGRLRPLGLTTTRRLSLLPDYPTVAETVPGYEFNAWAGILVPAKTPKETIAAIHDAVISALNRPDVSKRLTDLGYVVVAGQPDELAAYIKSEIAKMAKLIRDNNLTAK
ncbi:MAG: hypothetical protein A3G24_25895 [Betaproteobacteria bacterium RIFCSPLOWO2_12_FULL_62_13]|nr:MAG: hypothetical protein A3G24_25895 [Betaproteobacteria bacterium RIFCSPLOWO2_12_FULL_62_13]